MSFSRRTQNWLALVVALITLAATGPVRADPSVEGCIDETERGQALRDEGELLAARQAFLSCAEAGCPGLIRKDCIGWHAEVDALVPSIVARAQDDSGRDLAGVVFRVDGEDVALDGTPHELDPGTHTLAWTHGERTIEQSIVARAGEKNRLVDVTFAALPTAAETPPPVPAPSETEPDAPATRGVEIPVATWVLAGVGVTGGVLFAAFASHAVSERDALRETCAPSCTTADVDAVERDLIVANVSGGVGIAAVVAAVVVAIVHNVSDDDTDARALPVTVVGAGPYAGRLMWQLDL